MDARFIAPWTPLRGCAIYRAHAAPPGHDDAPSSRKHHPPSDDELVIPRELYDLVREALHRQWDPIGVSELTDTFGEYDTYVTPVCALLLAGRDTDAIFAALWNLETGGMGLAGDRDATTAFANWLVDLAKTRA